MSSRMLTPTLCKRRPPAPRALAMLMAAALLASASAAHGAITEATCLRSLYKAAGKYTLCEQRVLAKLFGGGIVSTPQFDARVSACRVKYTGTWAKLQAAASGSGTTCDNPRFEDNGDGTVTDRLTALQWEQKTQDASVHNTGNLYTWTSTGDGDVTNADGTAFTSFLATLNSGGCFAGQCDWRLPTIAELQTILLEPYWCMTSPCIDQAVFGPTGANYGYWSATTLANVPEDVWTVRFSNGSVFGIFKRYPSGSFVRAVRAVW